jgi:hypothetical protein
MADTQFVQLIARADIPTAELTILDSRFQFVHRGVGEVDVQLPPGAYLVQYKTGTNVEEVTVILRPGAGPVEVPSPALSTKSPAPLAGNEAGTRYRTFAEARSREVHERHGQGGELFIMVRTSTQDLATNRWSESLFDVQLLGADLNVLSDLHKSGKRSEDGRAGACNLELTPGTYLLRYKIGPSEQLEQSIVVSEGWQTQVFASSRLFGRDSGHFGPNLPDAAVFIAPRGAGFDSADINAARAESARIGLASSCAVAPDGRLRQVATQSREIRASLPESQVHDMLKSKFQNPMLGIYGAHLMLLGQERHWDVLREVISTLKTLLGNHPDVVALTLLPELEGLTERCGYDVPPMLRNSWTLVVGKSVTQPDLVPGSAYSAVVANRLWGAAGWLVWRPPTTADISPRARSSKRQVRQGTQPITVGDAIALLHKHVLESQRRIGADQYKRQVMADRGLTDTERAILMYAARAVQQGHAFRSLTGSGGSLLEKASTSVHEFLQKFEWADRLTGGLHLDPSVHEQFVPERLVRTLGIPAASLNHALLALAEKVRSGEGTGPS